MTRMARLMTRIATMRVVLMVGILIVMTREWKLGKGGEC